jgi:O-antigen/teichoic acid export membrane protein
LVPVQIIVVMTMQRRIHINGNAHSLGWSGRILAGVFGVLFLILGLVFGAVILSLAAIAGLALAGRFWWLRRQFQRQQPGSQVDKRVIEGEYRVIDGPHKDRC